MPHLHQPNNVETIAYLRTKIVESERMIGTKAPQAPNNMATTFTGRSRWRKIVTRGRHCTNLTKLDDHFRGSDDERAGIEYG